MEPFDYINLVPGKDVRGKLIDAFQVSYEAGASFAARSWGYFLDCTWVEEREPASVTHMRFCFLWYCFLFATTTMAVSRP